MSKLNTLLLDTNAIIYLINGDEKVFQLVNQKPVAINFIIEIELLGWKNMPSSFLSIVTDFLKDVQYFDYSYRVKQRTIALRRQYNFKLGDAFIAATAIEFNLTLVSADNIFSKAEELHFIHFSPAVLS